MGECIDLFGYLALFIGIVGFGGVLITTIAIGVIEIKERKAEKDGDIHR